MSVIVAPSLLSCDFAALKDEVKAVERAGANWLHLDVMDGHFVPNISIGVPIVEAVRRSTTLELDVHLMISQPSRYVNAFAKAGANRISIHVEAEATDDKPTREVLAMIRAQGCKVGLALSPGTGVERLLPFLPDIDMALVMTVNPGFGGQALMPEMLDKVRAVRALATQQGLERYVEVDGGINAVTVQKALDAGADVIVAGSFIFNAPHRNYAVPIEQIRACSASALRR